MQSRITKKKSNKRSKPLAAKSNPSKTAARAYPAVIAWSTEDACYVARVPALRGCSSHGYTMEEASRNISDAAEGWLETAHAEGIEIPSPPRGLSGVMSLRMPVSLHEDAARLSALDGVSINQWVVSAVAKAAGRLER